MESLLYAHGIYLQFTLFHCIFVFYKHPQHNKIFQFFFTIVRCRKPNWGCIYVNHKLMLMVEGKSNVHFNVWFRGCLCSDYFTVPTLLQATLQAKPCLPLFFLEVLFTKGMKWKNTKVSQVSSRRIVQFESDLSSVSHCLLPFFLLLSSR